MATQQLPITSPIKGVVRAVPREGQPPATAWDAQNCLPYDRYGRLRLSQRAGLKKEFNVQLSDGTDFIQGMIEAPNIIYPPGTFPFNLGPALPELVNPFTFDVPGSNGPYTATTPTGAFGPSYEWDFTFSFTGTVTPTGGSWFGGQDGFVTFYWPLQDMDVTGDLILLIHCSYFLSIGSGNEMDIIFRLYTGDVTDGGVSWIQIISNPDSPNIAVPFPDGSNTGTVTKACSVIINSDGNITIKLADGTPNSGTGATGLTQDLFPQLAVQDVTIASPTTNTTATMSITVTD